MKDEATVLVVDDAIENIMIIEALLEQEYCILSAENGQRAIDICLSSPPPDLILLDVMMPGLNGFEVCRRLKSDPRSAKIPVIFVTSYSDKEAEAQGFKEGAVDFIPKPIDNNVLNSRVKTHINLSKTERFLETKVQQRTEELMQTQSEVLYALGRAGEFKDNDTGAHVYRMSHFAKIIASKVIQNKEWLDSLLIASPIHDIGKIGIPDAILLKEGPLDIEEWKIMKTHPQVGNQIIGDQNRSEVMSLAKEITLGHHEKWDGSGYPLGLKGEDIPFSARVVALADVFDALTSERPYKKAWSVDQAVKHIDESFGQHFDPILAKPFHEALSEMLVVKEAFKDVTG
ncbi:MAG TPA: response regulator [Methylococcaceae bacterium]|nr:response regulator [Methylococcaceae bacterium]HIN69024.1 response regulator [Methylococcales bacterium]HIA44900.1 response regulator [Methylococcaceae bacterium]HIB63387.1 response regulator [Methylococcaceae bacterium]HIO13182.1 response regulator [Methylococcales bacterium]